MVPVSTSAEILKRLRMPIRAEMKVFQQYFRNQMRSNVFLLNLILRYLLRQKGKQIRPLLVLLSAKASGGITERTYIGATMVEILHTATLIHDDVVDQADERRGMASIRKVWKNKAAVLVGDYLLSQGLLIAVENESYDFLKVTSEAVKRMSEGELRQIQRATLLELDEESYFDVIRRKTASLIATCCEIGALSANAPKELSDQLRRYGEALGIAFQIRDDILDYLSRSPVLGKPIGNDVQEQKVTLPLIYALSNAPEKERERILSLIRKKKIHSKNFSIVQQFVQRYNGIAYADNVAREYAQKAKQYLDILPPSEAQQALKELTDFVISREL